MSTEPETLPVTAKRNSKTVVTAIRRAADQALRKAKPDMPTRVQFTEDMLVLESAFLEKLADVWKEG